MEFAKGTYNIKGLFFVVDLDTKKIVEQHTFYEGTLEIENNCDLLDMIESVLPILNSKIPQFLTDNKLHKWIALKKPSWEYHEETNTFELGYYHNKTIYDTMYQYIDEGYIMAPLASTVSNMIFDEIYGWYGLTHSSDEIYAIKLNDEQSGSDEQK